MKNLHRKSLPFSLALTLMLFSACLPTAHQGNFITPVPEIIKGQVVYGVDDRQDPVELQHPMLQELARSSAAQINQENLSIYDDNYWKFKGKTLVEKGICPQERFANQLAVARCSGFLAAPNLIVTAGHCISNTRGLRGHYWVFDYQQDLLTQNDGLIPQENIFRGKRVVERRIDPKTGVDYAVIELDREVDNRQPLNFRHAGSIEDDVPLAIIGNPSGLPIKIAPGGAIRQNQSPGLFVATLDSFGGNSGSPVINLITYEVEGILVRGEVDYELQGECQVVKHCSPQECRGEDVVRITNVTSLQD